MGALGEAIAAYAGPLLEKTDGSLEEFDQALQFAAVCWNLAILTEEEREETLAEIRLRLQMGDDEFEDFRRSIVLPMIRRHEKMFPQLHRFGSMELPVAALGGPEAQATAPPHAGRDPRPPRNAPCPCGSRRKYKNCCGR
ncbi:MAG: SEC-C metal-binding domain-containing protein [Planctomycetota bacterium]